jgi:putative iron-only hydrogenase system regulator
MPRSQGGRHNGVFKPFFRIAEKGLFKFKGVCKLEHRIGVIGIVVEDLENAQKINSILSEHNEVIVGRMGIPYRERGLSVISLIIDGSTDEIGAMTGKLGNIKSVKVKTALVTK